jgi:hypothetical protein
MAKPVPSGLRDIAFLPAHRKAIIIAPDRVGLKPVRILLVQMLCHAKLGDVVGRNLLKVWQ